MNLKKSKRHIFNVAWAYGMVPLAASPACEAAAGELPLAVCLIACLIDG